MGQRCSEMLFPVPVDGALQMTYLTTDLCPPAIRNQSSELLLDGEAYRCVLMMEEQEVFSP